MHPTTRACLSLLITAATWSATAAPVAFQPLEGAPYSASATVSPYAAKVFLAGQPAPTESEALSQLINSLSLIGLDQSHLAYVRASLLAQSDNSINMERWNASWNSRFPSDAPRPARTTLSANAFAGPTTNAQIQVEAVAAYLPDPKATIKSATPSPFNPYISFAGEGPFSSSAVAIARPGSPMLFSAGVLADPADPSKPDNSVARFGSMKAQSASVFKKLEASIASQGFRWEDVLYVRALLSPDPETAAIDFDGFGAAFQAAFAQRHPALKPALAMVAGPGFNANGRLVEVEVYAAAPEPAGPFSSHDLSSPANPWLAMTGTAEAQISSTASVARFRSLTWFSGVIGTTGADMHDQSISALLTLRSRLAAAGLGLGDTVQLRAYPVVGNDFRKNMAQWNEAYARFFNIAKLNPHKPARTSFPLVALPRNTLIEIEVIATGR